MRAAEIFERAVKVTKNKPTHLASACRRFHLMAKHNPGFDALAGALNEQRHLALSLWLDDAVAAAKHADARAALVAAAERYF